MSLTCPHLNFFLFSINKGFDKLRLRLPKNHNDRRLSKVDTLKQAIKYIRQLTELLQQEGVSPAYITTKLQNVQAPMLLIKSFEGH